MNAWILAVLIVGGLLLVFHNEAAEQLAMSVLNTASQAQYHIQSGLVRWFG